MANYANLLATIAANIYTNNNGEVTAAMVKSAVDQVVASLSAGGYLFKGIATPTSPGTAQTPDEKVFYISTTPGTYTYLGGLVVNDGEVAILKYDSTWSKEVTGAATAAKVTELGQKLIKLEKWGNAGNPTDLQEGDFYTPDGTEIIRVDEITDGRVTEFTRIALSYGAIYTLNDLLYIYDGTILVQADTQKVITLSKWGLPGNPLDLQEGDYYTPDGQSVIRVDKIDAGAIVRSTTLSLLADKNLFIYDGLLYVFDGTNIVTKYWTIANKEIPAFGKALCSKKETINGIGRQTVIDVAQQSDVYGLFQGYYLNGTLSGSEKRVSTLLLDAFLVDLKVKLTSSDFVLKGAISFDKDYTQVQYDTSISGNQSCQLAKGYYYEIVLAKTNNNDVTPDEIAPYILVNDKILLDDVSNQVKKADAIDWFKCATPFLWSKLAKLKSLDSGFVNIGFIGDSWTQGTQNYIEGVLQSDFQGYVKPLSKLLQDEYGYGGLGWLDFSRDKSGSGNYGKMFGCADMYEHWQYVFAGNVTGLDGSKDEDAPDCLGICCAHTIFGNNSTLELTFNAGVLDKFKIRYYKDAHFSVSVNGGAATEITANSTDGWQETELGTTGTDTTNVLITSLADDTIIFGMDCFYGTKGVRCHKVGNRSISASDYLLMNATQWQDGIKLLGLDWVSVLLAINDLGSSTSESKMDTIVTNINSLIGRFKNAYTSSDLVTCDINLLGVENIESSGYTGLGALAKKQKEYAFNNGCGWCSTDKCIGSKKDEFTYTGTFSDEIHLNAIGSFAYAEHIYNCLFKF